MIRRPRISPLSPYTTLSRSGHGARLYCDPSHILRLDIEKLGVGIDETPDQPRAGDPVYRRVPARDKAHGSVAPRAFPATVFLQDRKSTRLNSSHSQISYAVF